MKSSGSDSDQHGYMLMLSVSWRRPKYVTWNFNENHGDVNLMRYNSNLFYSKFIKQIRALYEDMRSDNIEFIRFVIINGVGFVCGRSTDRSKFKVVKFSITKV